MIHVNGPAYRLSSRGSDLRCIRIRRIAAFLFLTFALSWGFDLLIAVTSGHKAYLALGVSPLGMFFPAFGALVLRLFVFKDSPIYFRRCPAKPRLILYGFLFLTIAYGIITFIWILVQAHPAVFQGVSNLLIMLWTLLVLNLAGKSSKDELGEAGLQLGDVNRGVKLGLGVVAFFALQAVLNLLFGLGQLQSHVSRVFGVPVPEGLYPWVLVGAFLLTVTGVPLSGLAVVFGEEYGWRGYLQDEWAKLGKRRGALVVGLVWGLWHFPVILSGVHTYPSSSIGLGLGVVFFILWGLIQSYAVLKAKSIWVAAFLHGVVNSVYAFMLTYIVNPGDKVLSFGLGVYGLACLTVVVVFVLRDPVWD